MMDDFCSRSQQDSFPWTLWLYDELPSFVDDGWFLLTITTGFIPLDFIMIIWRASFLRGWWMMILAHHHKRISPGYVYHELPLVDDGWMNLCSQPYTIPLVMIVTSFLLWMMDEWIFAHNHTRFPWLWLSQASFVDDGWILLTNKPQLESPVNQQPPAHSVGWMDGWMDGWCVHRKTLFRYILVSI
jgi:hypothetical protein